MKAKDIKYVFEQNPELSKLGTKIQYYKYLKTVFPESMVEDIVYHGTPEGKIATFDKKKQGASSGFFFSNSLEHADKVSKWKHGDPKINYVKLNLQNPLREDFWPSLKKEETKSQIIARAKAINSDGLVLNTRDLGIPIKEYISFEPSQIYHLGSKKDLNGFKEFLSKDKSNSLEERLVQGFFIFSILAGLTFSINSLTGNTIGTNSANFNFAGVGLFLIGIFGIVANRKLKNESKRH